MGYIKPLISPPIQPKQHYFPCSFQFQKTIVFSTQESFSMKLAGLKYRLQSFEGLSKLSFSTRCLDTAKRGSKSHENPDWFHDRDSHFMGDFIDNANNTPFWDPNNQFFSAPLLAFACSMLGTSSNNSIPNGGFGWRGIPWYNP